MCVVGGRFVGLCVSFVELQDHRSGRQPAGLMDTNPVTCEATEARTFLNKNYGST